MELDLIIKTFENAVKDLHMSVEDYVRSHTETPYTDIDFVNAAKVGEAQGVLEYILNRIKESGIRSDDIVIRCES